MELEAELKEMRLTLPEPPSPITTYVTAMQVGNLLFLSGTTCFQEGRLMYKGRVGAKLTVG